MENKDLVRLGRTDATSPIVVGTRVYDPLIFHRRLVQFSRRQYRFLNAFRLGVALEDAATQAGMTPALAERFLKRSSVRAWLEDRAKADYIKNQWEEPAKWWKEGDEVWVGKKFKTKEQMDVWKAFGERIAPVRRQDSQSPPKIEINIDPTAVQEAFRRQQSIEAEIVREQAS